MKRLVSGSRATTMYYVAGALTLINAASFAGGNLWFTTYPHFAPNEPSTNWRHHLIANILLGFIGLVFSGLTMIMGANWTRSAQTRRAGRQLLLASTLVSLFSIVNVAIIIPSDWVHNTLFIVAVALVWISLAHTRDV